MDFLQELVAKFNSLKDPFEKSRLVWKAQERGISSKDIAKALKVNPSYLSHLKRLSKLPEMLIDGFYAGSISLSHLFVISRLREDAEMIRLYEKVLKNNLSVQETEVEVRRMLHKVQDSEGKYFPKAKMERIKKLFQELLPAGVDVKIIQTRVKVKVVLEGKGNLRATGKVLEKLFNLLDSIKSKGFGDFQAKDSL